MDSKSEILAELRKNLINGGSAERKESEKRFFKEEIKTYGWTNPSVHKFSREMFSAVNGFSKLEVFSICEELWKSGYMEEAFIACDWCYKMKRQYVPDDFAIFQRWISDYVTNWATCDTFCNHSMGDFLMMYPEFLPELKLFAMSENRWMRRAAAVSLILPARKGLFLNEIFEIADILLLDKDDLVQKGYGWMLKESSKTHLQEIFGYVLEKRNVMPRTALRYAIEKMPDEMRKKAMEKL